MNKLQIEFLNKDNVDDYQAIMECIDPWFGTVPIDYNKDSFGDELAGIRERLYNYQSIFLNSFIDPQSVYSLMKDVIIIIAYNNSIANFFLKREMPIFACTYPMNSQVICFLACVETDLIYQVFVHELVHAYRLCQLKIKTFKDYIVYNNLLCNVIYEEIVASSFEKSIFSVLSWNEIMGGQFKKIYKEDIDRCITAIKKSKDIEELNKLFLEERKRDIIYSFCKMYALDKMVDQLLPLSAKNGLMNIVYDSGTFIRNQNIKGCDYD